jgi:RHS repeat-associated protein
MMPLDLRSVMGATGQSKESSHYNQFYLFQGREYLQALQIYDYPNRYYLPTLGRFLQIDPKGFGAGDVNLFRYCGDDPIDRVIP